MLGATRNLGHRSLSRDNNFDLLRLIAAALVLVSHSFPLSGHVEPSSTVLGTTLGGLGVTIFFAISGFLVARSWFRQPKLKVFVLKRTLRIMPGLMVAAALTAFVMGTFFTHLGASEYLSSSGTYAYIAKNWTLLSTNLYLPGVFEDNVYPDAVNGSLWTLPLEACAYATLAALAFVRVLHRPRAMIGVIAVSLVATSPYMGLHPSNASVGGIDGSKIELSMQLVATFLMGATLFLYRDRVLLHPPLFVVVVAAFLLTGGSDLHVTASILTVPYIVLFLAYWQPSVIARRLTRHGDVSYGMYIYAFPIQQSVAAAWTGTVPVIAMFALAFPITYAVAFASWQVVERPALRLKRRHKDDAGPTPAVD